MTADIVRITLCSHCSHAEEEWMSDQEWWQKSKVRELSQYGFWKYEPWMAYECSHNLNPLTRDGEPCIYYKVHVERFLKVFAEIGHLAIACGVKNDHP